MASNHLTTTLLACQSHDAATRRQAEQTLSSAEETSYSQFTHALATELSTETNDLSARHLAGLHFKNLLVAKDPTLQHTKHQKWKSAQSAEGRAAIKTLLLSSLASPQPQARDVAAQACAEVAALELPESTWPELVPRLKGMVTDAAVDEAVKVSTLKCLGYTCERIASLDTGANIDVTTTDDMLNTIVEGIRADRPDPIRLAAAQALRNSLLFTRKNFEVVAERNMILQTICEATQSPNEEVRAAAFENIVQIAYQYYDKLQGYMQTLFQLSFQTISSDTEKVALQAIEFWSTLCEEEIDLLEDARQLADSAGGTPIPPPRECIRYVQAATDHLVPLLTATLLKQDEDADAEDEIWNLSMAASTCLGLIAGTVEDLIVPAVMPFVEQNIRSEEWRKREAATMAFSAILDGPSVEIMAPYVNQAIPVLLGALSDAHPMVKDTTAWTIGRICELHVRAIPQDTFPVLVNGLAEKLLAEKPNVSSQACFALHNLAAAFDTDTSAEKTGSNALSVYMAALLERLLQVADRKDATESNLRVAAFEAVSVLIQNSAPDCKPLLVQLLPSIIQRLATSFSIPVLTNEDRTHKEGMQGLLCGLLQVLVYKLEKVDVMPHADAIMQNLLSVLQVKNATCHEEAFASIGAVCTRLEADFDKYMQALAPFLKIGLENFESYQVCSIAVGLIGDISRAIESKIAPYCNDIMTCFVKALQDQYLHRSVKPAVLSCFGDIALALGAAYEPYLQVSVMMLMQASQTAVPDDDEDLIDYVNLLREGVLEAYTGIIQGLKDGNKVEIIAPYIVAIIQFLEVCLVDENREYGVLGKAAGLVGDIASAFGPSLREHLVKPFVQSLITEAYQNGDESTQSTCDWARGEVQKALQA